MKKTIVIAGSEGSVGKAAAETFKDGGWYVIGIDQKKTSDNDCIDAYICCNVRDSEAIKSVIDSIEEKQPIDSILNVAGHEIRTGFEETPHEEWEMLLNTILGGTVNLCGAAAPYMVKRKTGSLLLISTDYSQVQGDCVMNATAMGTLHGFGKSLGVELASDNVRVNVIFANAPFDLEAVAHTAFFLADKDTYTTAQVVSVTGRNS